jgi:hypothetical protein
MQEKFMVLREEFNTDSNDAHYARRVAARGITPLGGPGPVWNLIAGLNVLQWEVLAVLAHWRNVMHARRALLRAPVPVRFYTSIPANLTATSFEAFLPLDWGPPSFNVFGNSEVNHDADASGADTDTAGSDDDLSDLPGLLDYSQEDEDAAVSFYREVDVHIFSILVVEEAIDALGGEIATLGWKPQGADVPLTP